MDRRRLRRVAALAVGLGALLVLAAWLARLELAERAILRALAGQGLEPARLRVTELGFGRLVVEDVALGEGPAIRIARMALEFDASDALGRRFESLELEGVEVHGSLEDGVLKLGGLERRGEPEPQVDTEAERAPAAAEGTAPLAIARLVIRDATLRIETAQGPATGRVDVEAALPPGAPPSFDVHASLAHPFFAAQLAIAPTEPAEPEPGVLSGALSLSLTSDSVASLLPDAPVDFEAVAIDLSGHWRAAADAAAVTIDGCAPIRLAGGRVAGRLEMTAPLESCLSGNTVLSLRSGAPTRLALDGRLASMPFRARLARDGADPTALAGRVPAIHVVADLPLTGGALDARVSLDGAKVTVVDQGISVSGLSASARVGEGGLLSEGRFAFESARWPIDPGHPVALSGKGEIEGGGGGAYRMRWSLMDGSGLVRVGGLARLDAAARKASTEFRLEPLLLGKGLFQPAKVLPRTAKGIELDAGTLNAAGQLRWRADAGLGADVALHLDGLTGRASGVGFAGVTGPIAIEGPGPWRTAGVQTLELERLGSGDLKMGPGELRFELSEPGPITLVGLDLELGEGRIEAKGGLEADRERGRVVLELERVDLQTLIGLTALDGLSAHGRISGRIPLSYRAGEGLTIDLAKLEGVEIEPHTSAPPGGGTAPAAAGTQKPEVGWIRYRPAAGPAMAASAGEFGQVLKALEDFHYEELVLDVAGDALGNVQVGVHLKGSNPGYLNGHPFELNFNVDSALPDLLKNAVRVYEVMERLERRFTR